MKHLNKPLKTLLIAATYTQITACSKTVKWEEEVPLNTGEVIIIKRSDDFIRRSVPGNPFEMGWWLNGRSYRFSWQGKDYSYDAKGVSTGPIILYVYPEEKNVSLIDSGWPFCSGYAELRWENGSWNIQRNMNPAIIGRPRNIMQYASAEDGAIPARVTPEFIRNSHFYLPQRGSSLTHLPASKVGTNCVGSK